LRDGRSAAAAMISLYKGMKILYGPAI